MIYQPWYDISDYYIAHLPRIDVYVIKVNYAYIKDVWELENTLKNSNVVWCGGKRDTCMS